ncbi:hypothetical protein HKD37_01G001830 [Glycine soja]
MIKKCCTLRHPYQTRAGAKTKIISDIEQVQGHMKGDMKAMKEHMTMMMEAMISMRKMMEVNIVSIAAASASTERDPTHSPGFNQESHWRRRSRADLLFHHMVCLPIIHCPLLYMSLVRISRINNLNPITLMPMSLDHTLTSIRVYLRNTIEGHSFSGIPVPNALGVPQYRPPSQPLHFRIGGGPPTVVEKEKDLVAQVVPPTVERQMITMIMDTLSGFYYEKMIGYMPSSFMDLVFASERIEVGLRRGKFDYVASVSSDIVKRYYA